jgi:predicted homoserine dehydrogenase-like protein
MILVDTRLEELERASSPLQVAMIGAGFMARGIALQFATAVRGMRLACVVCRNLDKGISLLQSAGYPAVRTAESPGELDQSIREGVPAVTQDFRLATDSPRIHAVLEVTGSVEYGAQVISRAIRQRKHAVLMNPELDGTLGPLLFQQARDAGVIFTNVEGDQPGVILNLYRFVKGIGARPVLCGNIKGLHDPYRNPTTQAGFAARWGQNVRMVTSFADGAKISFEQAIVANATGFRVARRGMLGPTVEPGTHVSQAPQWYPHTLLGSGAGLVDYVVGAEPSPGIFVIARQDHPVQRHYLKLYKLGDGPFYTFYTPYHLCHMEVPNTIARAVLFTDAAIAPWHGPRVDVIAAAKTDLSAGAVLDGLGGYTFYGLAENYDEARRLKLLPAGLAEGCRLKRDIPKDQVILYDDVELPERSVAVELRLRLENAFPAAPQAD